MTTEQIQQLACIASLTVSVVLFAVRYRAIAVAIQSSRLNTSRFRLFAARDCLVDLVKDGEMRESDPEWQAAYRVTNRFLCLDRRRDYLALVRDNIYLRVNLLGSESLRTEFESATKEFKRRCKELPNFKRAIGRLDSGLSWMISERTSAPVIFLHRRLTIPAFVLGVVAIYGCRRLGSQIVEALRPQFLRDARNLSAKHLSPLGIGADPEARACH